ncbi:unnamed protein product [Prunus brigantina]
MKILPLVSSLLSLVSPPWLMVLQPSCNLLQLPAFLFEIPYQISTWVCSSSSSSSSSKKASLLVLELRWHGVLNL